MSYRTQGHGHRHAAGGKENRLLIWGIEGMEDWGPEHSEEIRGNSAVGWLFLAARSCRIKRQTHSQSTMSLFVYGQKSGTGSSQIIRQHRIAKRWIFLLRHKVTAKLNANLGWKQGIKIGHKERKCSLSLPCPILFHVSSKHFKCAPGVRNTLEFKTSVCTNNVKQVVITFVLVTGWDDNILNFRCIKIHHLIWPFPFILFHMTTDWLIFYVWLTYFYYTTLLQSFLKFSLNNMELHILGRISQFVMTVSRCVKTTSH